jgi:tetratricopeptide (TPR) repeat protein
MAEPGTILKARYRLDKILGQGGFATTWQAQNLDTDTVCAIKEVNSALIGDWKSLELFEREAGVLSHLEHPHIPRLVEFFTLEEQGLPRLYLVQEHIAGRSLSQLLNSGKFFNQAEAERIARAVLEVLVYLQSFSPPMIHRDIKPSNIMLDGSGKVWLIDFGAVRDQVREQQGSQPTVIGTFGYMPIEQIEGHATPASDLYALGMTLVHLLTRREPQSLEKKQLKVDFRPHVNISSAFANWIDQLIEPDVQRRFPTAQEALQQLHRGDEAVPLKASATSSAKTKGQPWWALTLEVIALVSLGFMALGEINARFAPSPPAKTDERALPVTDIPNLPLGEAKRLANNFYEAEAYGEAIPYFSRVLQLAPRDTEALFRRAFAYGAQKQYQLAIHGYQELMNIDPKAYPMAMFNIGWAYNHLKQYRDAIPWLTRMIAADPNYTDAYNSRGLAYLKTSQLALAEPDLRKVLELNPNHKFAHNNLGDLYYERKDYAGALGAYQKALELDPAYELAFSNKGWTLYQLKRYPEAIAAFDRALVLDPKYASAYAGRGLCAYQRKQYPAAEADFKQAIQYSPQYLQAHYNLGLVYHDTERYPEALAQYQKALEIQPSYSVAHNNQGVIYQKQGKNTEAVAAFTRAMQYDPKDALYPLNRGKRYRDLKDCGKAKADFQLACRLGNNKACQESCP